MDLTNITAEDFEIVAADIMNNYLLKAGETEFIICELEFYLKSDEHPDPYVHCDPDQLTVGKWYFHKRGGTYRGGTFKGLDITFGEGVYGGILIRAMQPYGAPFVEGPCNCVHAIMHATGHQTVANLTSAIKAEPDYTVFDSKVLRLVHCTRRHYSPVIIEPRNSTVYMSKRVGLNPTKAPVYAEAPYRYVTFPERIKKQRADIRAGMREHHGLTDDEIKALFEKRW